MRGILVRGEPRSEGGDLEEDAGRLAEVDRAEPEAVDDLRRMPTGLRDEVVPRLVVLHRRGPRDMVDRARAADAGRLRRFRVLDPTAARVGPRVPAPVLPLEAERSEELVARPAVRADTLEALQCELPRVLGMARHEWLLLDL